MKKLFASIALIGLLSVTANAGVIRFTAKHVVKPVAKTSYHGFKFVFLKVIF